MKYLGRAVRYLLKIVVLCTLVVTVLYYVGWARENVMHNIFGWRGIGFAAIVVVWAFVYAKTGFVKYTINASLAANRTKIIETMQRIGYKLLDEQLGTMKFGAVNWWTKISLAWDDVISISAVDDKSIVVDGARSIVSKIDLHLMRAVSDE